MIKSKCCGSGVITYWGGGKPSCSICGRECDTIDPDRPAFHVDDKLKEAAKKAKEVFEEEEKTDLQRLEEKVDKLGEMVAMLLNDKVDKMKEDCSPNFWTSFKFK